MEIVESREHYIQFIFNPDELVVCHRHSPIHDHFKYDDEELMFKVSQFCEDTRTIQEIEDEDQE